MSLVVDALDTSLSSACIIICGTASGPGILSLLAGNCCLGTSAFNRLSMHFERGVPAKHAVSSLMWLSGEIMYAVTVQMTEALAYSLYMTISTFLPNVTTAVILFYGGNLVLEGSMSAGSLVSFMLYQQSLSNAFQVSY